MAIKSNAQLAHMYYSVDAALNPSSAFNYIMNKATHSAVADSGQKTIYLFADLSMLIYASDGVRHIDNVSGTLTRAQMITHIRLKGRRLTIKWH